MTARNGTQGPEAVGELAMSNAAQERSPAAAADPNTVNVSQRELADALSDRLSRRGPSGARVSVVWALGGERAVLQADRLRVSLRPGALVVELSFVPAAGGKPLPLVTTFRVGHELADAVLTPEPVERPLGDARISARWAVLAADMVWVAVLELGAALASARSGGGAPRVVAGVYTDGIRLSFATALRFREGDVVPARRDRAATA